MNILPQDYLGCLCEVKTMQNEVIATGMIGAINDEYIDISGRTGILDDAGYRTEVKINIFNAKLGFRVLTGMIYLYNDDILRIVEVSSILDYERRHFFRVDVNLFAEIYMRNPESKEEISLKELYSGSLNEENMICKEARIENLSLGGCMIDVNELLLNEGDTFYVGMKLLRNENEFFHCKIHRITEKKKKWSLGCSFVENPEKYNDDLCAFIFKMQREQIKETRL